MSSSLRRSTSRTRKINDGVAFADADVANALAVAVVADVAAATTTIVVAAAATNVAIVVAAVVVVAVDAVDDVDATAATVAFAVDAACSASINARRSVDMSDAMTFVMIDWRL